MKIFQILLNKTKNSSYRYAEELYLSLSSMEDIDIDQSIIVDKSEFTPDLIDIINSCDYVFIHSISKDKDLYNILINFIKPKKILFITHTILKQWHNDINLSYIIPLLRNVSKIVINPLALDIINEIKEKLSDDQFNKKYVELKYVYNFYLFNMINKDNIISMTSNKGIRTNYDLFINLFKNKEILDQKFIWKLYGITKNLQTYSVNDLYINNQTQKTSLITNFDNSIISNDKINVYGEIDKQTYKEVIEHSLFTCNFDNESYISYNIIDIIGNGSIPILSKNVAQNIRINQKQTLYDLKCGIFINDTFDEQSIITINKLVQSPNTYINTLNKHINIFKQIFNNTETLNKLLSEIL